MMKAYFKSEKIDGDDRRIYETFYTHQPFCGFRPTLPPDILQYSKDNILTEIRECHADTPWAHLDEGLVADAIRRYARRLVEANPPYTLALDIEDIKTDDLIAAQYAGKTHTGVVVHVSDQTGAVYVNWLSEAEGRAAVDQAAGLVTCHLMDLSTGVALPPRGMTKLTKLVEMYGKDSLVSISTDVWGEVDGEITLGELAEELSTLGYDADGMTIIELDENAQDGVILEDAEGNACIRLV